MKKLSVICLVYTISVNVEIVYRHQMLISSIMHTLRHDWHIYAVYIHRVQKDNDTVHKTDGQ